MCTYNDVKLGVDIDNLVVVIYDGKSGHSLCDEQAQGFDKRRVRSCLEDQNAIYIILRQSSVVG